MQFFRSLWDRIPSYLEKALEGKERHTIELPDANGVMKPYLTRYYLTGTREDDNAPGRGPRFYVHHFHASDAERELHNHPWTGLSLILFGGYYEQRAKIYKTVKLDNGMTFCVHGPRELRTLRPGCFNFIGLADAHRAELRDEKRGAWTLFLTGKRVKDWGFLDTDSHLFRSREETGEIP